MKLTAGQRARDFQLMDIHRNPVSMNDYPGKKLIFPFIATPHARCATSGCTI
jgi:peroxiredoxin